MDIEIINNTTLKHFHAVRGGEIFVYGGDAFMRLKDGRLTGTYKEDGEDTHVILNALCLSTGVCTYFRNHILITPAREASLEIKV